MSETLPPSRRPPVCPSRRGIPPSPKEPSFGDRLSDSKVLRLAILLGGLGYLAYVSLWAFALVMALVVSVFLHEMGHFLVAKRAGMKVTEFFLGFGPRIWSFRRGETEYGIKFIPAGAYVKIIGMSDLEEVAPEDEERSYRSQRFMKRMPVVLAGPAMNLAIGFLLLVVVIAGFGRASDTGWSIRSISTGSAAEAAGLQSGDRLIRFDGQDVGAFENLRSLAQAHAGTNVELTVVRDGQEIVVPVTLGWALTHESGARLGLRRATPSPRSVGPRSAPTPTSSARSRTREGPVTLSYVRGTATFSAEVQGPLSLPGDAYRGMVGITEDPDIEHVSVLAAVPAAGSEFGNMVVGSVQGMGRIFSPSGVSHLFHLVTTANDDPTSTPAASPPATSSSSSASSSSSSSASSSSEDADRPMSLIGIVKVGAQLGEEVGWGGVLILLALVNIFLGLINLVPLLPLDGGHVAVACYEEIRTRISHRPYRVDMAKLLPVTYVVILLILGLGLSTMYLDVVNPPSIK